VRKCILAAGAAAAVLAVAFPSRANGRYPSAFQLVFSPKDPNTMVLRATYAILPSSDNGITWRYLCEGIVGLPENDQGEDPSIGIMSNGNLIVGVPGLGGGGKGMNLSSDQGCNWSCQGGGLLDQSVIDLAVRPDDPSKAVAVTGTLLPDAGIAYRNQVFETTDNGQTWTALPGVIDPLIAITTIDVTKTDPDRIYVTGTAGYGPSARAVFLVSRDHGATWTQNPVPQFDPTQESGVYIGAVDPVNPDRVYLRSAAVKAGGLSRVYYSTNGGVTFALAGALPEAGGFTTPEAGMYDLTGELLGMTLSPDGSKLYVGTVESGLWIAHTSDMMFEQKNPDVHVQCLATRNDELWACSTVYEPGDFTLGVSTDDGATFQTRIRYVTSLCGAVECAPNPGGPLGCGADGNGAECKAAFDSFCALDVEMACGTCPASDSGASPAPADGGASTKPGHPSSSSCSCTTAGRGDAGFAAGLAFTALAGFAFGRRRVRR
jgi:photosystem II stability/assembly factor-like uncharacterized protein